MSSYHILIEKNSKILNQAFHEQFQIWMDYVLFSWRWWIGVSVIILCLIVWYGWSKRESIDRLLYIGFIVALFSTFLDQLGNFFGLWGLRYEVFPAVTYITWDLFFLPTFVVFLILFKPNEKPFLKGLVFGGATSFIGLPLMSWLKIYTMSNWEFIYSLPIQFFIFLSAYYFSKRNKFEAIEKK